MKTLEQIREAAANLMEISKDLKRRYVQKAISGDDELDNSMVNTKTNRKIPQKHRDYASPNPQSNKDLDRHMKNRTKGVARATGSDKVAKSAAKSATRAAKTYRKALDRPDEYRDDEKMFNKAGKTLKKATDKAVKSVK